ncbi:MAG: glycosyltransferase family 4 protein [Polyangiaceae bacterium]
MMSPRIVYIITTDTSADILLRGQLAYLVQNGFEVSVICGDGPRVQALAAREGVRCYSVPFKREFSALQDVQTLFALWRLLRELRPDIVNASTSKAALLGLSAAWLAGVPHRVYLLRGLRLETLGRTGRMGMRVIERFCSSLAEHVLCVSGSLERTYVSQHLAPARKCRVLGSGSSNGIDTSRFFRGQGVLDRARVIAAGLALDPQRATLGFVGRPVADKGIGELLSAFRSVRAHVPDAQLLVVGAGFAGDAECSEMAELRRSPGVFVVGAVEDVTPYYCLMNVLVFPSHREGFPNVVLEASAMGVPAVGFDATGVRDAIVDGQTGQLCPMSDSEALARAALSYLRDRSLAARHSDAGARRAREEFSRERVWGELAGFYHRALGSAGPDPALEVE